MFLYITIILKSIIQNKSCVVKYYDLDNPPFTFRTDPHKTLSGHNGNIYVQSYKDNRNCFGFKIPVTQELIDDKVIYF